MTLPARAASRGVSAERWHGDLLRFVQDTATVADMEVRKLRHDPLELLTRAVQPVLWLLIFGKVMAQTRAIPTGGLPYLDFLAPGILAQSALFVSIFYGIAVIWERDLGVLHKFLVSPASRAALVSGKALSAGVRALSQALIVYALAAALGVGLRWGVMSLMGMVIAVVLGAAVFATFSLIVACLVKTRERFMGIGQILTMPVVLRLQRHLPDRGDAPRCAMACSRQPRCPIQTDLLRTLMLRGATSTFGLPVDFAVLIGSLVVLVTIAARIYPRVVL